MKSMQLSIASSPFNGTQLCSEYDTEIFYPEEYTDADVAQAKSICGDCWIKEECLSFAIKINEKEGVWGGTTPAERRRIRRRLRK